MAPSKFGLFKARSKDHQEQPSTENLLQSSSSSDNVTTPGTPPLNKLNAHSPKDLNEEIAALQLEESDAESQADKATRRLSMDSDNGEVQQQTSTNYIPLKNQPSTEATSTSTLQNDEDFDAIQSLDDLELEHSRNLEIDNDGASTSGDANSLQFDVSSIAPSEDISVYCGHMKKPKKSRSKEEQQIRDLDMWQASNLEVMQNLLSRSGTLDEQIKWEAIATARGLCTLKDNCVCGDCSRGKWLAGVSDGDGGMGAVAPVAISLGCVIS